MAGEFEKLVAERNVGPAVRAFELAIAKSFQRDGKARTQAEVKRRFDICADVFCILVHDVGLATAMALPQIEKGLLARLDGLPWEPESRMIIPCSGAEGFGG